MGSSGDEAAPGGGPETRSRPARSTPLPCALAHAVRAAVRVQETSSPTAVRAGRRHPPRRGWPLLPARVSRRTPGRNQTAPEARRSWRRGPVPTARRGPVHATRVAEPSACEALAAGPTPCGTHVSIGAASVHSALASKASPASNWDTRQGAAQGTPHGRAHFHVERWESGPSGAVRQWEETPLRAADDERAPQW